jgi:5-dehydro-2-deoxygluconokinase
LEPELGPDIGGLEEWPLDNVVKVLCFCHPSDAADMWDDQGEVLTRLFRAARRNRLEFLLEIIPSKVGPVDDATTADVIRRIYEMGIFPDWWKLEPQKTRRAWEAACATITECDPHIRGILMLGLDAPEEELAESFQIAAGCPLVKGFAVGRTIFGQVARDWLVGRIGDEAAVEAMAERYQRLCAVWDAARLRTNAREEALS